MRTCLIVDDSRTQAIITRRMLARHGIAAAHARDAREGIARARREPFDLIFMDLVMPGVDGIDATRILCGDPRTAHVPVVLLTANDSREDRERGLRAGAREYLLKPLRESALLGVLSRFAADFEPAPMPLRAAAR